MESTRADEFTTNLAQQAYRLILGRPLEAKHLHALMAERPDGLTLMRNLLHSEEFLFGRGQALGTIAVPGLRDLEIIRTFPRYQGAGEAGYVTDFLGIRTDVAFVNAIVSLAGHVEGYPIPRGNFHGDLDEWCGLLDAVLVVQDRFVAVELGMGWAPWLVAGATVVRLRGITNVALAGVEASKEHVGFARRHMAKNGIDEANARLIHGAIAVEDGVVEFPIADDPAEDWGMAAFDRSNATGIDYRGHHFAKTEQVQALRIETVLQEYDRVDLLHIDIQGHEADCVAGAIDVLNKKVATMIVGTHGRAIEERLMSVLAGAGWRLSREASCKMQVIGDRAHLLVDGCQVWHNLKLRA